MTDVLPSKGLNLGGGGTRLPDPTAGLNVGMVINAPNPADDLNKTIAQINKTMLDVRLQQTRMYTEARSQDLINQMRTDINGEMVQFTSLKNQDAIDARKGLDEKINKIVQRYSEKTQNEDPAIQFMVGKASDDAVFGATAKADSHVMEETVNYRNQTDKDTIYLASNELAANYHTALYQQSKDHLDNTIGKMLEDNGYRPNTPVWNKAYLETKSGLHKAIIEDTINGDQFGTARSDIKRAVKAGELTAQDQYDLLNKLRNAEMAAAQRNLALQNQKLLNRKLKFDNATRYALTEEAKAQYLSLDSNRWLPQVLQEGMELPEGWVEGVDYKTITPDTLAEIAGGLNAPQETIDEWKAVLEKNGGDARVILVPKSAEQLDRDSSTHAYNVRAEAELAANEYDSMTAGARSQMSRLADAMKDAGVYPDNVGKITNDRRFGIDSTAWSNLVRAGFDGDANKALQYVQGLYSIDRGNPKALSDALQTLSIQGTAGIEGGREGLINNLNEAYCSPKEIETAVKEYDQSLASGQNSLYSTVINAVKGNYLVQMGYNINSDASADDKAATDGMAKKIWADLKPYAARTTADGALTPNNWSATLAAMFASEVYQGGLAQYRDNYVGFCERLRKNAEITADWDAEDWERAHNIIAADPAKYAAMDIEEFANMVEQQRLCIDFNKAPYKYMSDYAQAIIAQGAARRNE